MKQHKAPTSAPLGDPSFRSFLIDQPSDIQGPITITACSDTPYLREDGWEILSHDPKTVDLTRVNTRAAILEDQFSRQIGVVEKAWLDGGKLRAEIRFSKLGDGYLVDQDIRDGIRSNVSIGYIIYERTRGETGSDGIPVWIATKWMPYEISIVAIPADITVGVGRSAKMSQAQYDGLKALLDTAEVEPEAPAEEVESEDVPAEDTPTPAEEEKSLPE